MQPDDHTGGEEGLSEETDECLDEVADDGGVGLMFMKLFVLSLLRLLARNFSCNISANFVLLNLFASLITS